MSVAPMCVFTSAWTGWGALWIWGCSGMHFWPTYGPLSAGSSSASSARVNPLLLQPQAGRNRPKSVKRGDGTQVSPSAILSPGAGAGLGV